MLNNYQKKNIIYKNFLKKNGYTFLEFILVITLLGITSSIAVPLFNSTINKARQREANLIVSSIIKSVKANYGLYGFLPSQMGQISKFARYQKCIEKGVESKGRLVCKNAKIQTVARNDTRYFSPSGNYRIDIESRSSDFEDAMFLIKANPNGNTFKNDSTYFAPWFCYPPCIPFSRFCN